MVQKTTAETVFVRFRISAVHSCAHSSDTSKNADSCVLQQESEAVEGPHAAWCADISCANTKMNRVKLLGYVDYRAQRLRFSGQSIELTAADKLRVQMQFNSLESKI